jgi:hypothetical protein
LAFGIGFRRIEFLLRSPEVLIRGLEGGLLSGERFLIELDLSCGGLHLRAQSREFLTQSVCFGVVLGRGNAFHRAGTSLLRFLVDDHGQRINGGLIVANDLPHRAENFIATRFRQVGLAQFGPKHFGIERLFLGLKFRNLLGRPVSLLLRGRLCFLTSCAAFGALQ